MSNLWLFRRCHWCQAISWNIMTVSLAFVSLARMRGCGNKINIIINEAIRHKNHIHHMLLMNEQPFSFQRLFSSLSDIYFISYCYEYYFFMNNSAIDLSLWASKIFQSGWLQSLGVYKKIIFLFSLWAIWNEK